MCFSAGASFGAGVVLSAIGITSLKKSASSAQLPFAGIPLLFAVQQLTEGVLWLSLTDPDLAALKTASTHLFLVIAQVVWPFWVPFSIFRLETRARTRLAGKLLVATGSLVSLYLAYCLFRFPVEAKITGNHMAYKQDFPPQFILICGFLYFIATITPPFFSRIRRMWMLGATIFLAYVISTIFYADHLVSVWCFFAALISIAVFFIIHEINKPPLTFPAQATGATSAPDMH